MTYTEDSNSEQANAPPERRSPVEFKLKTYSQTQPKEKTAHPTYIIQIFLDNQPLGFVRLADPDAVRHLRRLFSKEVQDHARSQR